MSADPALTDQAPVRAQLHNEQLRLHRSTLPVAIGGSLLWGALLIFAQSRVVALPTVSVWVALLLFGAAVRMSMVWWHRHESPPTAPAGTWIGRYRWVLLADGLVWMMAGVMLFPPGDLAHQMFLVLALVGLSVGALSAYAFDLRAGLLFSLPVLLVLLAQLLLQRSDTTLAMAGMVLLFMAYACATAWRAHRNLRETLVLRAVQGQQVDALRRSHAQMHSAEQQAGLGSFVFDTATRQLTWSDGHFRLWGREAASSPPDLDLFRAAIHPEDRERVEAEFRKILDDGRASECDYRIRLADGTVRHIHGRAELQRDVSGHPGVMLGTVQDVTQRVQVQAALAEKQQLLAAMLGSTEIGFWFVDRHGRTTDANPAMCGLLGQARESLLSRSIVELVDADLAGSLQQLLDGTADGPGPGCEVDLRRPDGSTLHCLCHGTRIPGPDGGCLGLVATFTDLSAVTQAQDAQHVSEFIVNSVNDMVSVTDLDGIYRFVNDVWCRRTGLSRAQVIGQPLDQILPQVMSRERGDALAECIADKQMRVVRADVVMPSGGERSLETTLTPNLTPDGSVRGVVAVTRDVTDDMRTRDALAQSLETLRRTFNATTDGMIAYDAADPEGRLLFANTRFFEIWGMAARDAHDVTRAQMLEALRRQYAEPQREEARLATITTSDEPCTDRIVLRDGRIVERRSVPMHDSGGPARVWTFRDITLEQQALDAIRDSDGQQRALMDAFPGYVAAIDQDFVYTYMNQRLAALFGKPVQDIVGHHVRDVLGEERYLLNVREVERCHNGERVLAERQFEATADRPRVYLQFTHVMGVKGRGGLQRYYTFGIDISELKRAEEALRGAKDEAERANRAKSAFLASVSHELRTPLNAILGFSQLLRTESMVSPAASENAGEIERAGRHLLALVDDLIDLGGVEAGHLELTMAHVSVEAVINESLSMVAPLAANQGIRIVFDGGDARHAFVRADTVRLRQVIINLMSNAIKYNRPDGSVRVTCQRRVQSGGDGGAGAIVRIAVKDTGIGIAPETGRRVFSAFERLGAERGAVEGTGIGLAISRRLISAMGGAIGYESRLHEGSTFWVDLAIARSDQAATPSVSVQPLLHRAQPRLLVAEDYGPNQAVIRLQLSTLGCAVDVVANGVEALAKWETQKYDLILSDLDMPHMGGHGLARTIRRREKGGSQRIAIIALSAAVAPGERERCIEAGMDDMLTKPIAIEGLSDMLVNWLGAAQQRPPAPLQARPAAPAETSPEVLDLDALYRVLGRISTAQAAALLQAFLVAARRGLEELAGPKGGDPLRVVREMHRQQSSARTVGAMAYAAKAAALEQQSLAGVPRDLARWLDELGSDLQQVEQQAAAIDVHDDGNSRPLPLDEPAPAELSCRCVLVVDDDTVVLMQMQQMLAAIGVQEILTARNGIEAIVQMGRRDIPVDVVVCDLNMPEMDGIEMIRRFGQSGFRGALVLMSGADEQLLTTVGNLAQMQGLSVLGQVHKPATPAVMRALLARVAPATAAPAPAGKDPVTTPEALRHGIAAQEFEVWFQPKVDAHSMQAVGVEALARWRQADGGLVPPELFIVVAERAGTIGDLSATLVTRALQQGARLHAAGFPLKIAINLSALWLDDLQLPDILLQAALGVRLTPEDIILEVTETGVTKDVAVALDVLTRLRLKGFGLSIDDFGIGYSSFEQLGRIPFTEMKLDRSFVKRGGQDAAARAILESSMAMAGKLALTTVAEGVETQAELDMVRGLGCDIVQGYLVARPMPVDELLEWLRQRATSRSAARPS